MKFGFAEGLLHETLDKSGSSRLYQTDFLFAFSDTRLGGSSHATRLFNNFGYYCSSTNVFKIKTTHVISSRIISLFVGNRMLQCWFGMYFVKHLITRFTHKCILLFVSNLIYLRSVPCGKVKVVRIQLDIKQFRSFVCIDDLARTVITALVYRAGGIVCYVHMLCYWK